MAMTKRERETVDGHDQKRERQSMAMTKRERETVDGHDQEKKRADGHGEREQIPTTKRERVDGCGQELERADGHGQREHRCPWPRESRWSWPRERTKVTTRSEEIWNEIEREEGWKNEIYLLEREMREYRVRLNFEENVRCLNTWCNSCIVKFNFQVRRQCTSSNADRYQYHHYRIGIVIYLSYILKS